MQHHTPVSPGFVFKLKAIEFSIYSVLSQENSVKHVNTAGQYLFPAGIEKSGRNLKFFE